jgi:hypothetical protein
VVVVFAVVVARVVVDVLVAVVVIVRVRNRLWELVAVRRASFR